MTAEKQKFLYAYCVVRGLLILASFKFESGNTVKSTKTNLKKVCCS